MIEETGAALPHLLSVNLFRIADEPTHIHARLERTSAAQAIGIVARLSSIDRLAHKAVALVVMHWCNRAVDRNFVKVWTTETQELRVEVGKQSALQQGIISEVDAGYDVTGMKSDLLCFGEEVFHITIQCQPADASYRNKLFRDDLRRIEQIKRKAVLVFLFNNLNAELPLREIAVLDCLPEITSMKVRILAGNLLRLVPNNLVQAKQRFPVKLDEARFAPGVDKTKRMHAEPFHHPEASRYGTIRHRPHDHVHRFGHERDEVPEGVVSSSCLRDFIVRLRLDGMHEIGKLDGVLDKEDWNVIAHQIVIAFFRIKLDREATHVPRQIGRSPRPHDG